MPADRSRLINVYWLHQDCVTVTLCEYHHVLTPFHRLLWKSPWLIGPYLLCRFIFHVEYLDEDRFLLLDRS